MNDRFMDGFLAGLIAGIISNLWSYFSFHILKFTQLRYVDFASVAIYGKLIRQTPELILAQIFQLGFSAFWGVIFAYLSTRISKSYYVFKGTFYGLTLWGAIYCIIALFRIPELAYVTLQTAISNYTSAAIYGGVLAFVFRKLEINAPIT